MKSENLALWVQHEDINPSYTKPITGKDYKGTSPNAHHIIRCLTEMFGPVGKGFGWRVLVEGIENFGDTAIHWCRIEFWHTDRANTFESYGQTKMSYMTRGKPPYLKVDEDAPKKSLTDAITKAASQIGIASNIFLGRWDDNKYVAEVEQRFKEAGKVDHSARISGLIDACKGEADLNALWIAEKAVIAKLPEDEFETIKAQFGAAKSVHFTPQQMAAE